MAKLSSPHASSEIEKIKTSNAAYYNALSARDLHAMEKVWTCAADDILIAPPNDPHVHVGWMAIKRNWAAYWPLFDRYSVSMKVNKVNISGPVAWVHGIETSRRLKKSGEVSGSENFGTNIFVNRNGRWLMVFHQAAEIPQQHFERQDRSSRKPTR